VNRLLVSDPKMKSQIDFDSEFLASEIDNEIGYRVSIAVSDMIFDMLNPFVTFGWGCERSIRSVVCKPSRMYATTFQEKNGGPTNTIKRYSINGAYHTAKDARMQTNGRPFVYLRSDYGKALAH
jgi:hypothetical protein